MNVMKMIGQCVAASGCILVGLMGCRDLTGSTPLPAGTVSPSVVQNVTGALQTSVAVQAVFQQAFAEYIPVSGALTDEFQSNYRDDATDVPFNDTYGSILVDARLLDQTADWNPSLSPLPGVKGSTDTVYGRLQLVRALAYQAIGGLATYAPDSVVLRGEMYAHLGYAEIMLADFYCSGIPLSTLDYQGDFTYRPGSTTPQVYQHAIALFDTAQTLAATSAAVTNLAKVGQGRAYLALGDYAQAAQAVSAVPSTFQFVDSLRSCTNGSCGRNTTTGIALLTAVFDLDDGLDGYSVSDKEAGTGLPFVSSGDPRTADTVIGSSENGDFLEYFPKKYQKTGISALILASGLEAQLITAEADLNAGNAVGMFTILNALRQSNPATAGLPPLHDPLTVSAEVDTLFTERAAWLFADGHRQGDLRRLMRNYVNGQGLSVVANQYPSGDYGFGVGSYGGFIDAPIAASELANPFFTGCLSRD